MIFAEDNLIASKSPRVHGPGLVRLVLAAEEEAEVVGCIERWDIGCDVSRTECVSLQRPIVHLLRLAELALVRVEKAQVVDRVECRCVLRTECLLLETITGLVSDR